LEIDPTDGARDDRDRELSLHFQKIRGGGGYSVKVVNHDHRIDKYRRNYFAILFAIGVDTPRRRLTSTFRWFVSVDHSGEELRAFSHRGIVESLFV
jgi:hypothetical protein